MIASVMHNYYDEFLRSFKSFIAKVTNDSITYYEFDYGSKTIDMQRMMNDESFEYPTCIIEMNDSQLVDNVGPIARNAMMNVNPSNHNMIIAENLTKYNAILLDKRWISINMTVTINLEDSAALLNYYDLFISQLPFNFTFYDYSYYSYIDVTPLVQGWDLENDSVENIFVRRDPTGYQDKYYAMIVTKPLIELTGITKNQDKENQTHSLTLSFENMLEVPNIVRGKGYQDIKSISVVIDTQNAMEFPILIDIPDNILTNKNIEKGIIMSPQDFHVSPSDERKYLEVKTDVDIEAFELALWVVEDSTDVSSKRILIPLKNAKIIEILDEDNRRIGWEIEFSEINWFLDFNFDNKFNFLKLVLFKNTI